MRDVILTAIILGLVPLILRNPVVGAYAWAWLSMLNPHRAVFGFAQSLPFSQIIAVVTLGSFVFSKRRRPFPVSSVTIVYLLLMSWMALTSLFAINDREMVLERAIFVAKIHLMLLVTLMLVRGRQDIDRLVWVVALSIGFFGIKGGIWTLTTGGGSRVWGPAGSMIYDNNNLAVALVMVLPLFYYLQQTLRGRWIRYALIACMVSIAFSILGSQSRGAFLAALMMAAALGLKSRYPVRISAALVVLGALILTFMPDSWSGRMGTIQSYEEDNSAMSRLYTWRTLWNVAVDRPLVGAGFRADTPEVFARYAPFQGAEVFGNEGIFVAHSIYFEALGEHGFPGLILFVSLGVLAWRRAGQLAALTRTDPEFNSWVPLLMPMVQVSLVGYAVGGAFLSMMNFDGAYYIIAFVVLVDATVRDALRVREAGGRSLAAPGLGSPSGAKT